MYKKNSKVVGYSKTIFSTTFRKYGSPTISRNKLLFINIYDLTFKLFGILYNFKNISNKCSFNISIFDFKISLQLSFLVFH